VSGLSLLFCEPKEKEEEEAPGVYIRLMLLRIVEKRRKSERGPAQSKKRTNKGKKILLLVALK
jgi:hypothetical protein